MMRMCSFSYQIASTLFYHSHPCGWAPAEHMAINMEELKPKRNLNLITLIIVPQSFFVGKISIKIGFLLDDSYKQTLMM